MRRHVAPARLREKALPASLPLFDAHGTPGPFRLSIRPTTGSPSALALRAILWIKSGVWHPCHKVTKGSWAVGHLASGNFRSGSRQCENPAAAANPFEFRGLWPRATRKIPKLRRLRARISAIADSSHSLGRIATTASTPRASQTAKGFGVNPFISLGGEPDRAAPRRRGKGDAKASRPRRMAARARS